MIGSDLPENTGVEIGKILDLEAPEETRRAILWTTAIAVFGEVPEIPHNVAGTSGVSRCATAVCPSWRYR